MFEPALPCLRFIQQNRTGTDCLYCTGKAWFVRVIRLPACARVSRVSRVCPGSPRCLFTGKAFEHV